MRRQISENTYGLIVIDVHFPGEDGFSLTLSLRENLDVGIIIVMAANDLADRCSAWTLALMIIWPNHSSPEKCSLASKVSCFADRRESRR